MMMIGVRDVFFEGVAAEEDEAAPGRTEEEDEDAEGNGRAGGGIALDAGVAAGPLLLTLGALVLAAEAALATRATPSVTSLRVLP